LSKQQLTAFLAQLKDDPGLAAKLRDAPGLDAIISVAQAAGFDVSKADWLKHQAKQVMDLSDSELEAVAGGVSWCCDPFATYLSNCC
jgi:predicted ribosomally synthesized peptide with nif11-like leader